MKNKFYIIFIFLINYTLFSQQEQVKNYLIYSYEFHIKKGVDGNKTYYWIIDKDSLEQYNNTKLLFLNIISKTTLNKCIQGNKISPLNDCGPDYFIDESTYIKDVIEITRLLKKNRILIAKNEFKYLNNSIKTNIYVTPVIGFFSNCELEQYDSNILKKSFVSVYIENFKIDNEGFFFVRKNKKLLISQVKSYYFD